MGRLEEALRAYDKAIAANPADPVARNGRANVLLGLDRLDEALRKLPDARPEIREDWVGYHIRGMVLLKKGETDKAQRIFEEGVRCIPLSSDREYFQAALALVHLRCREYEAAVSSLEDIQSPVYQPAATVLRFHAYSAKGQVSQAAAAAPPSPTEFVPALRHAWDELQRRFMDKLPPRLSDEALFNLEFEGLSLIAA